MKKLREFKTGKGDRGATGSGYALVVGLISIVALVAVTSTGENVNRLFGDVGDTLIEVAAVEFSVTPTSASGMDITSGPSPAFSAPVTFTLRNDGNPRTGTVSASFAGDPNFVIDSDGCSGTKLEGGATCDVTVSATASANGPYSGTLRLGTSAKFVEVSLSGEASGLTPAAISVDQPTVTGMNVAGPGSPATGTPVTISFTNDGDQETGTLTTGNTNATNFAITSDTCDGQTLTSSASCAIEITPQASSGGGTVTADVSVGDGSVSATSSLSGTVSGFDLYSFTSHVFDSCGQSGRTGPGLGTCRVHYSTGWDENNAYFNMSTNGIQRWTVPSTATYRLTVTGAAGGGNNSSSHAGRGAQMIGEFNLTQGDVLQILVGQQGTGGSAGGGGGGSFVLDSSDNPLIIAGGGGGYYATFNGRTTVNDGTTSTTGRSGANSNGGGGGTNGGGGGAGLSGAGGNGTSAGGNGTSCSYGPGGAGLLGNGGRNCSGTGGFAASFTNGGVGGNNDGGFNNPGGFGGGGSSGHRGGGGGGYSGGGGGAESLSSEGGGGGGGSFNSGANQNNSTGVGSIHGAVFIEKL